MQRAYLVKLLQDHLKAGVIDVFFFASLAAVENGETDTVTAESWEEKGEPDEVEAGGGDMEETGPVREEAQDEMMMEEDEEMLTPKLPPPLPDAPKKEHVNVVFIGHVGASVYSVFTSQFHDVIIVSRASNLIFSVLCCTRCWQVNNWWTNHVS